jgi:hypothetical protein
LQDLLALVRQRGGLAAVVIAGDHKHAAMSRAPCCVAVLQRVGAAIDTRSLAVPDPENAIDERAWEEIDLLRAPDRRRGEILVKSRLKVDIVLLEERARAPQRVVIAAQRRAAVARDEAAGIEPGCAVARMLHHRQPDQRLYARKVDAARIGRVFVVERYVGKRHCAAPADARTIKGRRGRGAAAPFNSELQGVRGGDRLRVLAPDARVIVDVELHLVAVGVLHIDRLADPVVLDAHDPARRPRRAAPWPRAAVRANSRS